MFTAEKTILILPHKIYFFLKLNFLKDFDVVEKAILVCVFFLKI